MYQFKPNLVDHLTKSIDNQQKQSEIYCEEKKLNKLTLFKCIFHNENSLIARILQVKFYFIEENDIIKH